MKLDVRKPTLASSEDSSGAFSRVPLSQSEPSSVVQPMNGKMGENESSRSSKTNLNGNSKVMSQAGNIKVENSEGVSSNPDKENTTSNMLNIEGKNGETYSCPLCNQVLPSPHAFTVHIRQHNPSDHSHTCRLCGKTLSSASSLDRHMLVHSGERPFKCRLCSMAFTTNGNMHRHMRTHGEENISNDSARPTKENKSKKRKSDTNSGSNGTFPKKKELEISGETEKLHCPVCDKTLYSLLNLQTHMELHPDDPIWCKQCGQALANYSVYVEHPCIKFPNKMEHNKSTSTAVGFQDLTFMDFSTDKFSLVAKSFCENSSRRPSSAFHAFECNKCDKSFPCNSALRLHGMVHSEKKRTFCPTCQCDFLTTASLKAHQLTHRKAEHCNAPESIKMEKIHDDQEENEKEDFMALLELKNKENQSSIKKEKNREPVFESMSYFVHGKPELPTQVVNISTQSASKGDSEHSDFADIQSIISVTSKSPLVPNIGTSPAVAVPSSPGPETSVTPSHIPPDSPPLADLANSSPETPSKEDSEQSSQKGSEDPESDDGGVCEDSTEIEYFDCKICKLSFKNRNALKRHRRSHSSGSSGSPFSCNMCPYTSLDKSTLIRHLRTHNGERPFQCAICKYAFTTKANCERHVRKRHKKLSKQEIRNAMQYNPNMTDVKTPEVITSEISASETICKYCNVDFKFNRVLRHHLRSLHNSCSRKPFFCILCKLGFSTKNNCIRHVLKQHPDKKDQVQDIVSANSQSDLSDQDSLQLSDESPQKEVPSDTEQPLNLSVKITNFSSSNLVSDIDVQSVDDMVSAANSLVSLSEILPPQDEPLDLVIHPLDLTMKSSQSEAISNTLITEPKPSTHFTVKKSLTITPAQISSPIISPIQPLELQMESHSPAPSVVPPVHTSFQPSAITTVEDLSIVSKSNQKQDVYKMTFKIVNDQLSPRNQRSFSCVYCSAGFTLKSNMERHIKRKHPEFARPTRSRNFIPTLTSPVPKSSTPTLSNKTRDALRVVLTNKAGASGVTPIKDDYQHSNDIFEERQSMDQSDSESLVINESEDVQDNNSQVNSVSESDQCTQQAKITEDSETAPDLASVSSVIDTANSQQFQQYLLDAQNNDNKKEEPKAKDKSNSENCEENNESGSTTNAVTKKRSSYTDSPNSVACPFCTRRFPWSSSLRRHILTHTGQKPYKCPRCPIWFTTKSNCERHLVRKHGQNSSEILTRTVPERPYKCNICPSSTFSTQGNLRKHYYLKHWKKTGGRRKFLLNLDPEKESASREELLGGEDLEEHLNSDGEIEDSEPGSLVIATESLESMTADNDLPYKCHLCEESFLKRFDCLEHLKKQHKEKYQLLKSKGAMDTQKVDCSQPLEEDATDPKDSTDVQRKVVCVLCNRRFWSAEDLRRHMRTHSGERPFTCDICERKFSLKHSMIRHHRKHHANSASLENESTDEECATTPDPSASLPKPKSSSSKGGKYNGPRSKKKKSQNSLLYLMTQNEGTTWTKSSAKSQSTTTSGTGDSKREDDDTDLIQNLLGIHDSKMIDEMLDSADSAARLLGVRAEI